MNAFLTNELIPQVRIARGAPMTRTAIILPAYNEELTVARVLEAFHRHMPDALLVVVDNNSSDRTAEVATRALQELDALGLVLFEKRQGKAFAVGRAFSDVEADFYVTCDADLTYIEEEMHDLLRPVLTGHADMVVGDRHSLGTYRSENKRPFHVSGNAFVRWLINTLFVGNLQDVLSGYRAFSRRFVKNFPISSKGFDLEAEMSIHALDKNFPIVEVPIHYRERLEGSPSKLSTFRDGLRIIILILYIFKNYRPLSFFSAVAFFFFVAGALAGYPPVRDYYVSQYIFHLPLAILATGLMILAFISLCIGLILDNVAANNSFQYRLRLLDWPSVNLCESSLLGPELEHSRPSSACVKRADPN
jgi:glycosyltransferase involved in cell wall biosynthesis